MLSSPHRKFSLKWSTHPIMRTRVGPTVDEHFLYMRTEVRFYNEILPLLQSSSSSGFKPATPHIFRATCHLDGLVDDDETPMEPSRRTQADIDDNALVKSSCDSLFFHGGYILMECISDQQYYQESPISKSDAKKCLAAVAHFHAAAWENSKLLQQANECLSRGSYHLDTRNPQEFLGMTDAWEHFSNQFRHCDPELLARTTDLGLRIQDLARYISDEISPGPGDPYATLAHGDFKAMNCFLPNNRKGQDTTTADAAATDLPVLMVDFASTGVGLGMSDVAMHIHHAVRAKDLVNGGEEELVDYYLEVLNRHLAGRLSNNKSNSNNNTAVYPRTVALRHYRLAVCDYFRFVLGRFWKSASPASFDKQRNSRNTLLANRNVASALAFLDRADRYLRDIEQERQIGIAVS
jgi:hypothetical protein